jgi:hypothetical protein
MLIDPQFLGGMGGTINYGSAPLQNDPYQNRSVEWGEFAQPATPVQQAPAPQLSREQWRDQWMGSGQMTPQEAERRLTEMGGTRLSESGVWRTPFGEELDLEIGRKAAMAGLNGGLITPGWTALNGPTNPGGQQVNGNAGFLQQLFASLGGGQGNMGNTMERMGAQPYNQYAGKQQSTSNLFGNMQPTGQSDGTLLGTAFSKMAAPVSSLAQSVNQQENPAPSGETSNWTRQPSRKGMWGSFSSSTGNESNQNQPMGAPSFYGKSEGYLPANNMGLTR